MRASDGQRGFTLIEVVVAFAVFAVCVGALLESFRGAMRRTVQARRHEAALLVAESVLARVRATEAFDDAHQTGDTPMGLRWEAAIVAENLDLDAGNPFAVYRVEVSVFDGAAPAPDLVLRSIELGRAD